MIGVQRTRLYILELVFIVLTALLSGILVIWVPAPWLRVPSGALLALFLPGYLLLRMIYPSSSGDTNLWKLGLILPVNVALTGIVLLFLNYSWGYTLERAIILLIILVTLLSVAILLQGIRKKATPAVESLFDYVYAELVGSKHYFGLKPAHLALFISSLFLIGAVVFAALTPRQSRPITDFYLISSDSQLISQIPADQRFKYGIYNHEGAGTNYRVEIIAVAQAGAKILSSETLRVKDDEKIERDVTLPVLPGGTRNIELRLYTDDHAQPYRLLTIPLPR